MKLLILLSFFSFSIFAAEEKALDESGIWLASNLLPLHKNLLAADIRYLKSQNIKMEESADPVRDEITKSSLFTWFRERVHFVVGADLDLDKDENGDATFYPNYPNRKEDKNMGAESNIQKDFGQGLANRFQEISRNGSPRTSMVNLGAALYSLGKDKLMRIRLMIPGFDLVDIGSPRIGVLKVGPGLFMGIEDEKQAIQNRLSSNVMTIYRLGIMMHEARHSDGNGSSLTFPHMTCPPNHEYAGILACDNSLNGPYTVGANSVEVLLKNCKECSIKEKTKLAEIALDYRSRVIRSIKTENGEHIMAENLDTTPEHLPDFTLPNKILGDQK